MKMCVHRVLISGYAEAVVKYMDLEWFSSRIISAESNVLLHSLPFSSVQSFSHVQLFPTPWIAARQASLSITNSQRSLRLTSNVMPSSHLILHRPLLLLTQSLPASKSFPMSQLFSWGGQSIGVSASASVLPMNTQDWSPLGWTGWISLQSKGLPRVFSNHSSKASIPQHSAFFTIQQSKYLI